MKIKNLYLQLIDSVDEGTTLEIIAADEKGKQVDDSPYPLATIFADEEDESLYFEMYTQEGIVQIPLSKLKKAFDLAIKEVHSEKWYDQKDKEDKDNL